MSYEDDQEFAHDMARENCDKDKEIADLRQKLTETETQWCSEVSELQRVLGEKDEDVLYCLNKIGSVCQDPSECQDPCTCLRDEVANLVDELQEARSRIDCQERILAQDTEVFRAGAKEAYRQAKNGAELEERLKAAQDEAKAAWIAHGLLKEEIEEREECFKLGIEIFGSPCADHSGDNALPLEVCNEFKALQAQRDELLEAAKTVLHMGGKEVHDILAAAIANAEGEAGDV